MNLFKWNADYSGRICIDGMALNGIINTLSEFQRQYYPGAVFLACRGECDCELVPEKELEIEVTTSPTPTTPAPLGGAGALILLDGIVKSESNQNPRPKKPQGNNNPDGSNTNIILNPRFSAHFIENKIRPIQQ